MNKSKNIFSELDMFFNSNVNNMTVLLFSEILKTVFPSLWVIVKEKRSNSKNK